MHSDLIKWLAFFYFYCIFGWIFESTYVSLKERRMINRGFMHGPWLPLYGSGAILVLLITMPFRYSPWLVYLVGAIGATALEYVTGEAMVKLFKVRYWDYSNQRIQFRGHICLSSSIAWGFLSLWMVYMVHTPVEHLFQRIPEGIILTVVLLITVGMAYDFNVALRNALDLRDLIMQLEIVKLQIDGYAEEVKEDLAVYAENVKERAEDKKRLAEATAVFIRASLEDTVEKKREILEQHLESIRQNMAKHSARLLLHNPGGKFINKPEETAMIKKKIQKIRKKQLK